MATNPERMPQAPPAPLAEVPRFEAPLEAPTPEPRWALRSWGYIVTNAIGAVVTMVALQMTWLTAGVTGRADAFVVPFSFLWQGMDANESAFTIGRVLMVVALIGLFAVPLRATRNVRGVAGFVLLFTSLVYAVQVARWDTKVIASLTFGIGTLVAIAGALLLLVEKKKPKAARS